MVVGDGLSALQQGVAYFAASAFGGEFETERVGVELHRERLSVDDIGCFEHALRNENETGGDVSAAAALCQPVSNDPHSVPVSLEFVEGEAHAVFAHLAVSYGLVFNALLTVFGVSEETAFNFYLFHELLSGLAVQGICRVVFPP